MQLAEQPCQAVGSTCEHLQLLLLASSEGSGLFLGAAGESQSPASSGM